MIPSPASRTKIREPPGQARGGEHDHSPLAPCQWLNGFCPTRILPIRYFSR